ncbi:MAG: FAD-dependent oxidoreductase [Chlamydiales bacterium]
MEKYDLIVIGSGPGGEKAAVKAAYFKHKVALIERSPQVGGTPVYEGIPAKVLKEMAMHLSGKIEDNIYGYSGDHYHFKTAELFFNRAHQLSSQYSIEVKENLQQHTVDVYYGEASFVDPHCIHILGQRELTIYGDHIIIAAGTDPIRCGKEGTMVDGKRIHNTKTILEITRIPKSLCICGMGISGCEHASVFALLKTKIFFINRNKTILKAFDSEIIHFFLEKLEEEGVEIIYDEVEKIEIPKSDDEDLKVSLKSGDIFHVEMVLFSAGRLGNTKNLNLENAGVISNDKGIIPCNEHYQTNVSHIYAVGDVNGIVPLANVAMDQGRHAVAQIFKNDALQTQEIIPFGMYTSPEIAAVGLKEDEVKALKIDYVVGYSYYSDITRGKLVGSEGMMKILFSKNEMEVLGVHIVGPSATELIHFGVGLVREKNTMMFIINQLFNFPTLHELYKYAAFDGLSCLTGYKMKKGRANCHASID